MKKSAKTILALILAIAMAIALISACGGGGSTNGSTNGNAPTPRASDTDTRQTPNGDDTPDPTTPPTPDPTPDPTPTPAPTVSVGGTISFGDYDWLVLDVQDGKVLIITEMAIDSRAYHNTIEDVTWATSDIREYLNGEFLNNFSDADRARIADTNLINDDNPWYGTPGGADTTDKIFLLSLSEVAQYFGDSGQLANRPEDEYATTISDEHNQNRAAKIAIGDGTYDAWWWLRSPGYFPVSAAVVNGGGPVNLFGYGVDRATNEVRPALWLNP